ncbi:hypothetical protein NQ314_007102 [Rhamnusium bicolor]|uniref:Vanin C-terminal domain-containing protein n=1 Tax=Rhamnusium bicolor TaxID=1586634 RepID=A0AAV8YSG2_9CUCU|nr:hypothetical protein NQ314_007102 [Rhamnusium bicolor]
MWKIVWPITFEYISVVANFTKDENRIQFPNSVLSSIRPISPGFTIWNKEELSDGVKRAHILHKPQNRLLTFGIFGRDFSRDSSEPQNNRSVELSNINFILLLCITFLCTTLLM